MNTSTSAALKAELESIWRDRLARHSTSNQTIEAFCHSESVSVTTFYKWRNRLGAHTVDARLENKDVRTAPFVELGLVRRPTAPVSAPYRTEPADHSVHIDVRLELGNGVVLYLVRS